MGTAGRLQPKQLKVYGVGVCSTVDVYREYDDDDSDEYF